MQHEYYATKVRTITKEHVLNWRTYGSEGVYPGAFTWALIDAMGHADSQNLDKLASVYPEIAEAMMMTTEALRNNED